MRLKQIMLSNIKTKCDLCGHLLNEGCCFLQVIENSSRGAHVYTCCKCGLIQTLYSAIFVSNQDENFSAGAKRSTFNYAKEISNPQHFLLMRDLGLLPRGRVLDIGAGRGGFLRFCESLPNEIQYMGIESKIKSWTNPDRRIEHNRFEFTTIKGKFDFIYVSHTLEHLLSCVTSLRSIKEILHDDGRLFIVVPNIFHLEMNSVIEEIFIDPHTFHFERETLKLCVISAGLEVLEIIEAGDELVVICRKMPNRATLDVRSLERTSKEVTSRNLEFCKSYRISLSANLSRLKEAYNLEFANLQEIVIWGAGRIADSLVANKVLDLGKISTVVDTHLGGQSTFHGIKVQKPEMLNEVDKKQLTIICSRAYQEDILRVAHELGFKNLVIYDKVNK